MTIIAPTITTITITIMITTTITMTIVIIIMHSNLLMTLTWRDLDLLRDVGLTQDDAAKRWQCSVCGNKYDTIEIENRYLCDRQNWNTIAAFLFLFLLPSICLLFFSCTFPLYFPYRHFYQRCYCYYCLSLIPYLPTYLIFSSTTQTLPHTHTYAYL